MKIEIELNDLENIRKETAFLKEENRKLKAELNELTESKIKEKIVKHSHLLFDSYMCSVFKRLGFNNWERDSVVIPHNLEHWIGNDWYNSERIDVKIGVDILGEFKKAFLHIGIKTE